MNNLSGTKDNQQKDSFSFVSNENVSDSGLDEFLLHYESDSEGSSMQPTIDKESEKWIYNFDYPGLEQSGYVETKDNSSVILFLPEKPPSSTSVNISKNVQLFVNTQHLFSLSWTPIYSYYDFQRFKEMLEKSLYEFQRITQWIESSSVPPALNFCSETIWDYSTSDFTLQSYENKTQTTIEINNFKRNKKYADISFLSKSFQIKIGSHTVFDSERELRNINTNNKYYIILYIMNKLIEKM